MPVMGLEGDSPILVGAPASTEKPQLSDRPPGKWGSVNANIDVGKIFSLHNRRTVISKVTRKRKFNILTILSNWKKKKRSKSLIKWKKRKLKEGKLKNTKNKRLSEEKKWMTKK